MDSTHAPSLGQPAIRAFRICVDRPDRYQTILGVVRRTAGDPAIIERSARLVEALPRRTSILG